MCYVIIKNNDEEMGERERENFQNFKETIYQLKTIFIFYFYFI
jgi:hypothetical protein